MLVVAFFASERGKRAKFHCSPKGDLNNSHSRSSQWQAQNRSPVKNIHPETRRSRKQAHPLDEHHSQNHEGKAWWSLLNYTVKTELMV
jgi:hypothetical protein